MDRPHGAVRPPGAVRPHEATRHVPLANRLPRWFVAVVAAPPIVLLTLFYVVPVAALVARFATVSVLSRLAHDSAIRRVLWFTCWQAALSTALTVAIGLVPAYVLARFDFRGRRVITALVTVPFVLPTVVVGAAFLALLPDRFDHSVTAIVLAHVFFNIAVVVRGVGGLWEQLPPDLAAAARTLGASPWRVTREITLPILAPAIAAAASVVFLFTFTSFGVVRVLGGPRHPTLEVEIWQRATRLGDIPAAAVLSIGQLVLLGLAVGGFARLQRRRRHDLGLRPIAHRHMARGIRQRVFVMVVVGATTAAVLTPVVALFERSLRARRGHSLQAWRALFGRSTLPGAPEVTAVLTTSLRFAAITVLISLIIGLCACVAVSALGRAGVALDTGLMLPLATSAVTIGFGLLITFDRAPFDWRSAPLMIPLGHALVAIPFVVRLLMPVSRSIDPQLRQAAATLGASPLRTLREIDLAVVRRPLIAAAGFAAAISLGEFGATSLLTRQGRETVPIAIDQLLSKPGALLHAEGYALAALLAAATFAVILAVDGFSMIGGRDARGA